MFCRISFILNHFNRNRDRNRFVAGFWLAVTFEFVICDIWTKCDQICFAKKTKKKPEHVMCHKFEIVKFCDRHKCHT